MKIEYRDLVLRISEVSEGVYRVRAESPAGESSGPFELPFPPQQLDAVLEDLQAETRNLTPPHNLQERRRQNPREVGESLFRALFPASVRSLLDRSLGITEDSPELGLRIKLQLDSARAALAWLHRLPWELLCHPETGDFLGLGRRSPIVRHLEVPRPVRPFPLPLPLRILVVISRSGGELDLAQERRNLDRIWAGQPEVEIVYLDTADLDALREALHQKEFHVLHFMGHGTFDTDSQQGALCFEGPGRSPAMVTGHALATTLADFDSLRMVFLNACSTAELSGAATDPSAAVAAALVDGGVPAVVAMQLPISDRAAIAFGRALYRRLAAGDPLDAAVVEGRHGILAALPETAEWATPVLFTRLEDLRLFAGGENDEALLGRYLEWVIEENRELDLPGLSGVERRPRIDLESVFVALRGDFSDPYERALSREMLEEEARRLENLLEVEDLTPEERYRLIWRKLRLLARDPLPWSLEERDLRPPDGEPENDGISLGEVFRSLSSSVILGDPGSGKTTLLRWLALNLASARRGHRDRLRVPRRMVDPRCDDPDEEVDIGPARVPILVAVGAYAHNRRSHPSLRLAEFLGHHLGPADGEGVADARGEPLDPRALNRLLRRLLAGGGAAVLLDGLDEIPNPTARQEVVEEIDDFLEAYVPFETAEAPSAPDAGNRAVVSSRLVGYRLAPLRYARAHLTIEPMAPRAVERFCSVWTTAVHRSALPPDRWDEAAMAKASSEAEALRRALAELRQRGAGELTGNPLLITVLALLFRHGRQRLPSRRVDLYEMAVRVLIDQWRRRSLRFGQPPLDEEELLGALVPLAAEIHRSSSIGAIGGRELTRVLERHLPDDRVATLRYVLRREVGLLTERGEGVYGFLHLSFQEYLAARWLIVQPEPVERLLERLEDPRWREPLLMALGLLATSLEPEKLEELLLRLLRGGDAALLPPSAALILIAALPEMPRCPAPAIEDAVRRLLVCRAGDDAGSGLAATIDRAIAQLLSGSGAEPARRVLRRALLDPRDARRARAAACVISAAEDAAPELVAALAEARIHDAAPWPIDRALRRIARREPILLPSPRSSLRRTLQRKPELAARFLGESAWRRIGLLVYGGLTPEGGFDLERCHYDSPWSTERILDALAADRPAAALAGEWRRFLDEAEEPRARIDASLALVAVGQSLPALPESLGQRVAEALDRVAATLAEVPIRLEPFLEPLRRLGAEQATGPWTELATAILDLVAPADLWPTAVLRLAAAAPATARPVVLADFWHLLLTGAADGEPGPGTAWHDPVYNLAVALDTAGEHLSEPPRLLAETLAAVVDRSKNRESGWRIESPVPGGEGFPGLVATALDAVAAIPVPFDFVRGWALVRLGPLAEEARLLDEALLLSLGLSDRLGTRSHTLRRLLSETDPRIAWIECPPSLATLLRSAEQIGDPWRRSRYRRCLALEDASFRKTYPELSESYRDLEDRQRESGSEGRQQPIAPVLLESEDDLLQRDGGDPEPRLADAVAHMTAVALVRDARRALRSLPSAEAASPKPAGPASVLDLAEREDLSEETLPAVLGLLDDPDDLTRQRAALVLHGDSSATRRPLSVRRSGAALLQALAREWLDRHEDEPRTAVMIRWSFERVEHDDARAISEWAELAGGPVSDPDAGEAELILGDLHALRCDVWPEVLEVLRDGPERARGALLRSLCTLLARRRVPAKVWSRLAGILPQLARRVPEEKLVLAGPAEIVEAVEAAEKLGASGVAAVEEAERRYLGAGVSWSEMLRRDPVAVRASLTGIGSRRLAGERSRLGLATAVERLAERPPRLEVLLVWLNRRLRCDVQGTGRDDHLLRDLLGLAAGAARRLPNTFLHRARSLPAWDRQLREVVEYGDWFPARQAALVLLSLGRRVTSDVLAALGAGLLDVLEVQRTALRSLVRYRELELELLPRLSADLMAESPARAFAVGRLVAALARNAHFAPELRRELIAALAAAGDEPGAHRQVYLLIEEPEGRHHRRRRIERLGHLDELFSRLLAEDAGLAYLFDRRPASAGQEN